MKFKKKPFLFKYFTKSTSQKIQKIDGNIDKIGSKIDDLISITEHKIERQNATINAANLKIDGLKNELHKINELKNKLI